MEVDPSSLPSLHKLPPPSMESDDTPPSPPQPAAPDTSPPAPRFDHFTDPLPSFPGPHWRNSTHQSDSGFSPSPSAGVSNCYVFKSRLQEYAQKAGILNPVYETVKEGPSHEPVFQSTVIVNNVKYDSLPGFYNRKAAEQSAAEIALMEIHKSGLRTECIPTLHETGLCKNLLQEYAQKMNYAIPSYICSKQPSGPTPFTCTVEIGGIQYIGGAARTKKEAEIKAARTALLAIRSAEMNMNGGSEYTVVPGKKKMKEPEKPSEATPISIKPRKGKFKRKWSKKKFAQNNTNNQGVEVEPGTFKVDTEAVEPKIDTQSQESSVLISHENEQVSEKIAGEPSVQDFVKYSMEMTGYLQNTGQQESSTLMDPVF
ncbi:double-stranded RNA-binding protein 8-like [Dioscorea cayenensis subsp. rotundata]|uniref:Double-stranded RNA-binding protein 8-like n=1 Tax=Dioscorea cayennensis subsp. rotundata TaxID=55577 RepID=A0AB40AX38_DIOCR|nr:double-stranded RNA-binding protein 8-like [Dioscorea cayenensis subsp. rotundata]